MSTMTDDLGTLGGKGANLVRLREAGFPVPPFVVLGTQEYRSFVAAHGLDAVIAQALATSDADAASETIRAAFRRPLPADQREHITAAVAHLVGRPVAVRSSATAEDLPEASFAGQQDTFLDVRGLDAILDAVVECWSSLWTERAIAYRARNGVPTEAVALAVVVQELVDAEAAGVLFTADPLTGHRGRTVVDAVFGLGEQLVSGQVDPDHFEVATPVSPGDPVPAGTILERTVHGGRPTLSDAQLRALTALGTRVANHFGSPQDIEWTRVGDDLQLVQTRPITSLFPLPASDGAELPLWLSIGGFQGMLDPITPLGRDALGRILASGARLFSDSVDPLDNPYLKDAAERLWVRFDRVLRLGFGRPIATKILPIGDPAAAGIVARLGEEPAFAPGPTGATAHAARVPAIAAGIVVPRAARTMVNPDATIARLNAEADAMVAELAARLDAADAVALPHLRLAARHRAMAASLDRSLTRLLPVFAPVMMPSVLMLHRLRVLAAHTGLPDADALALGVQRSLPGNVTIEMDLALVEVAHAIRADAPSRTAIADTDPAAVAASYLAGGLPPVAQRAIDGFLDRYGMRGVAEIDLGAPRWRELPEGVVRTIATYLALPDEDAPDAAHARGVREAEAAIERVVQALSPIEGRQFRFIADRLRRTFGARETPKFTLVKQLGLVRTALLASGRDLVDAGVLDAPDDVFFLHDAELSGAFGRRDLRERVAERRAARERELRRTRIPVVLVGDGRTFYEGVGGDPNADLSGTGVSPGVVEGAVRVVADPRTSGLLPGEILVCRGTDPAWTPLFLTASGLITEVGGLMTHGSVVAREYGLPAVVGVGGATERLATGQRIRLDGTAGTITFLDA